MQETGQSCVTERNRQRSLCCVPPTLPLGDSCSDNVWHWSNDGTWSHRGTSHLESRQSRWNPVSDPWITLNNSSCHWMEQDGKEAKRRVVRVCLESLSPPSFLVALLQDIEVTKSWQTSCRWLWQVVHYTVDHINAWWHSVYSLKALQMETLAVKAASTKEIRQMVPALTFDSDFFSF